MTIAFLATGDEIVHGDTLNSNSRTFANILSSEGFSIGRHLTCSDDELDMVECLRFLQNNHDTIIITGGLGPTTDDRTRFALASLLKLKLKLFPEAETHIKSRLLNVKVDYTENNAQQALFPEGAKLLDNPRGTAMGCIFETKTHRYILLPGPPRECLPMFDQEVLPYLLSLKRSDKTMLKWRVFGLPESHVGRLFESTLEGDDYPHGYRLQPPYVEVKVRVPKEKEEEMIQRIEPVLAAHIISPNDQTASELLRDYLDTELEGTTICIIDNVTGGVLQTLIQTPNNQHNLTFQATDDCQIRFTIHGYDAYWNQTPTDDGFSNISIEYQNANLVGNEAHPVPCRQTIPRHFAAEWISYRLHHLINQLMSS